MIVGPVWANRLRPPEPCAVSVASAMIDHHNLLNIAQRFGDGLQSRRRRFDDAGKFLQDRLQSRGIVEFTPRRRLLLDRGSFGQSLGFGGFSVCQTLCLYLLRLRQTERPDFFGFGAAFRFDRRGASQPSL